MTEGVDYSTTRPDPAKLYAAGKRFAVRYGGVGSSDKWLTASEVRALHGAGLAIVANAEGTARGLIGGAKVGAVWADLADAHFRALGMPFNCPIYFSVDWDVQPVEWPTVRAALDAACRLIGHDRVGVYGGRHAIEWAQRDGVASWFWQTYAWSGDPTHWVPGVHLHQYHNGATVAGVDCDLDRSMAVDYGQWEATMSRDYAPYAVPTGVGDRPDSVLLADVWSEFKFGHAPYGQERGYLLTQLDRIEGRQTVVTLTAEDLAHLADLLVPKLEEAVARVLARVGFVVRPGE